MKIILCQGALKLLCLSAEAIDKTIDFISDLLFEKDQKSTKIEYPYYLVNEFISPTELNFFVNLKSAVGNSAHIFSKVKLNVGVVQGIHGVEEYWNMWRSNSK